MSKLKGFTLVELLVVIAIIALLMSILMPALAKVRTQAKAVICVAQLKQWGTCFTAYTSDHDGYFPRGWFEPEAQVTPQDYWMECLRPCYRDGDLRLCPSATKMGSELGLNQFGNGGGPFSAWGVFDGEIGEVCDTWWCVMAGDYGSYGWNSYICNIPDTGDVDPFYIRNNWKNANVSGGAEIPMFMDHKWLDCWPDHRDEPPDFDAQDWNSGSQMQRICQNRHEGYINIAFMDCTVRKVGLKELWTLKWHRKFEVDGPWTTAGGVEAGDWPEWMRNFTDY